QCWCGAAGTDFDKYGPSTCDYACTGDSSATCGGYLAFDLFAVPQPAPTPAPTPGPTLYPKSLGCYKDVRESRVFVNMLSSDKMTPLVCAAHCSAYTFYATQYGQECWCGTSDVVYAVHGTSTCDMPCTGDASATCGGFYAFNVYNVPKAPTPAPTTPAPTVARLGCFKDMREDRVLKFQTSSSTMTPD
ncbi:unnamed protein product, partial [Sphacelaria rigidula]